MRSASSASSPDVRIGWGAINVQKALNYTPSASFCPNNCSGHGNCTSKGACQCETGFYDFDCSVATGERQGKDMDKLTVDSTMCRLL